MAPHTCPAAVSTAPPPSDGRAAKQPRERKGRRNNNNNANGAVAGGQQGTPRKGGAQKQVQNTNRGRQHSNQRKPSSDSEDGAPTPSKKPARARKRQPKVELLTRDAPEAEQQSLLARLNGSDGQPPAQRSRQAATPPASSRRAKAAGGPGVVFSPTPRKAHGDHVAAMQSSSPKAVHYAGASFNNSPAANTLPLPPSFLTTPTKSPPAGRAGVVCDDDVFGVSPRRMTLGEREQQLESIVGPYRVPPPPLQFAGTGGSHSLPQAMGPPSMGLVPPPQRGFHGSHSVASLDQQPDGGVASIFQKLRLAMDLPQRRPATVAPMPGAVPPGHHYFAPAYHA
ncbi:hypothetical protein H4R21_004964 [Coemansia helicoidea]|uniref:Uncharacterized protein n=1 Tax=Coemansia helicoidea TaxID=1286919 RepID=A0ACC1KVN4_9FUNG|nr:hypothetical protein H4R21_004964 [Coemansia helicoidea]